MRRTLLAISTLVLLGAGGAIAWLAGAGRPAIVRFSDGASIMRSGASAPERRVLWTQPEALPETISTSEDEYEAAFDGDAREMFFVRGRAGGSADIYRSTRDEGEWSEPELLQFCSPQHDELGPRLSPDAGTLYFYSDRPGGFGGHDLWSVERLESGWGEPRNLGDRVNTPFNEYGVAISPDASRLVFASNRPRDSSRSDTPVRWPATLREEHDNEDYDLFSSSLGDHGIGAAARIGDIASAAHDGSPAFSPTGDFLYFASNRAGGAGGFDLYRVRLAMPRSGDAPREREPSFIASPRPGDDPRAFGVQHLGADINTPSHELDPFLTSLGFELHFSSDREPLLGSARGDTQYDIFRSESREVFRTVEAIETDWAGLWGDVWPWLVWLLLLLLLILLLLWALRSQTLRERYRRLSLLAKCLIVSMLLHMLLLSAIGAYRIGTALGEIMDRDGGARVALVSREGASEIASQIRGDLTRFEVRAASLATLAAPLREPTREDASASLSPSRSASADRALEIIARESGEARPIEQAFAMQAVELQPAEAARVEVAMSDRPEAIDSDEARATLIERSSDAARAPVAEVASRDASSPTIDSTELATDSDVSVDVALSMPREIEGAIPSQEPAFTPPGTVEIEREAIEAAVAQPLEVASRVDDAQEAAIAHGLSDMRSLDDSPRGPLGTIAHEAPDANLVPAEQEEQAAITIAAREAATTEADDPPASAPTVDASLEVAEDADSRPDQIATPSEDSSAREIGGAGEPRLAVDEPAIAGASVPRATPPEPPEAEIEATNAALSIAAREAPKANRLVTPGAGESGLPPSDAAIPATIGLDLDDAPLTVLAGVELEVDATDGPSEPEASDLVRAEFADAGRTSAVRADVSPPIASSVAPVTISPGASGSPDRSVAGPLHALDSASIGVARPDEPTTLPEGEFADVDDVPRDARPSIDAVPEPSRTLDTFASGEASSLSVRAPLVGSLTRDGAPRPDAMYAEPADESDPSMDESLARDGARESIAPLVATTLGENMSEPVPPSLDATIHVAAIDDGPTEEFLATSPEATPAPPEIRSTPSPRTDGSSAVHAQRTPRPTIEMGDLAPRESVRPIPLADFARDSFDDARAPDATRSIDADAPSMPTEDLSLGLETPVELGEIPGAYRQRDEDVRAELIEDLGGTVESEAGVALALSWLTRHQSPEGFWSGQTYDSSCGACDGRSRLEQRAALTGLATLAFLGADHTHLRAGEHRATVRRAIEWLIAQQDHDGDLSTQGDPHAHALAATALAEALALTSDPDLREPVARAIAFIESRHAADSEPWAIVGGDDTPTLSWEVMALVSAQRAGLEIPRHLLDSARDRLDALIVDPERGLYALEPAGPPNRSATAEAMFTRRLLGVSRDDPRIERSARALARDNVAWDESASTFEWYMTTLSLHQHQGDPWHAWNGAMRDLLLARQDRSGPDAGSWPARDPWSLINGRVHQTAIGALMLESYYRYLPDFMDEEILDSGAVRGRVLDAQTGEPLVGAIVRLDLADRPPIIVASADAGRYTLRPPEVPDHVAMTATMEGYQPASINVPTEALLRGVVERDFLLERQAEGIIALEAQPEVHHLGNDEFTGRINSQFQRPSEGLIYQKSFAITPAQIRLVGREAQVRLLAKGTQAPNPVRVNGRLISRRLVGSPADGSFGEWVGSFPGEWLVAGENIVEIRSTRGDSDLDDFEFVNVQIVLDAADARRGDDAGR